MLHYGLFSWKGNCYCSFTDVFIAVATNIHNKVSFNIECFKNFLSFSPILLTISWALLTLYILTSVCIFSPLFSIHSLMCWQGEFAEQSRGSSVYYYCLYSHNLNVWFRVTLKGEIRCYSLSGIKWWKREGYLKNVTLIQGGIWIYE